jgi:small subunit ribosomal protein S1
MLEIGKVVTGYVSKIEAYGIYLNYQQYEIFVKIVDMTWDFGPLDPFQFTQIDDELRVKILGFIKENQYVGSLKDVYPEKNPWRDSSIYQKGKIFSGPVSAITEYGCFVKLETGVHGLIFKEDMEESLNVGDIVRATISEVDVDKERIRLKLWL